MKKYSRFFAVAATIGLLGGPLNSAASAEPVGPPQTLAAARRVVPDQAVESSFPIDFLGVFYDGDAQGATVRFRRDGRWGPWIELQEDGVEVAGRWASGLVSGSDASAYQVRVPGGARAARAVVINTTDGPAQTAAVSTAGACPDATSIVTRCEWGADESLMTWKPEFYSTQKLTVHHTATTNGDADPAATVRAIYRYQAVDRGFGDIGYQYLIDESGRTYEGRSSGIDEYPAHDATGTLVVTAAHVGGFNSGNTGIALLGTLTTAPPTSSARGSLEQLLGELTARHAIDPHGSSEYVNPVNGVTKSVANISGHRDWAATECPGGALYALLPAIRDAAAGSTTMPTTTTTSTTTPTTTTSTTMPTTTTSTTMPTTSTTMPTTSTTMPTTSTTMPTTSTTMPTTTDTSAPVISDVTASVTGATVTVRWSTDEPSTSQVEYTAKGATLTSDLDKALTASHSVGISGLARRTTYQYRVVSTDAAGNTAVSGSGSFKTR